MSLERDLSALLNKYSQENSSDTPDFVLADYLVSCLYAFNIATRARDKWYGRTPASIARAAATPEGRSHA